MLRAIWRLIRGIGYLFIGRVDGFTDAVTKNPSAMRGTYNEIIREKKERINEYMGAVGTLVAQQEKKTATMKTLTAEIEKLERLKAGAAGKAKERAAELKSQGKTPEEIKNDAAFKQCQASFADFSSTLVEKNARIAETESSLKEYSSRIANHKIQLTSLQREIENLKSESADAVADVISATEEKEINKVLSGISEDGTSAELERLRDLRHQAKAEAKVASELAGTDHKRVEAEYENFAANNESNAEFDALVGLDVPDDVKLNQMEDKLKKLDAPVAE